MRLHPRASPRRSCARVAAFAPSRRTPPRTTSGWTAAATTAASRGDELGRGAALAVADVFEALTADRPYRARCPREALEIMRRDAGEHLCPDAFAALTSGCSSAAPESLAA